MGDACSNFVVKTILTLFGWFIVVHVSLGLMGFQVTGETSDMQWLVALAITIIHTIIRIVRAYRRASAVEPDDYLESE